YLGAPKFWRNAIDKEDLVGMANGLAWTEMGGELLTIEAIALDGKGDLLLTGQLGSVMQESAKAALSYVRSRAKGLGLDPEFYKKQDIHIHVPEGAIPKDGPSAGISIAAAVVSALLKVPVKRSVAMTGEITLRGRILPVGGLKEKLLAAQRSGVSKVLLPFECKAQAEEVSQKIVRNLEILFVEHMDEVLREALASDVLKKEQVDLSFPSSTTLVLPPSPHPASERTTVIQ
ncbi:MAG: endopeptidase La, partial [Deltaproteobacteria bacterium]|nr:endopeptidase La [Deltaproteobacteria bacterium]